MRLSKTIVCVSTTKPSSAITPSGGGGSLTVLCPQTGSILSSLRTSADLSGKMGMGMSSLSNFPQSFGVTGNLVLSFGCNSSKKGDSYAMLLAIRPAPLPPILHWKCRLPETEITAGLQVSPCGHYVVGGGASGTCFVWNSVQGKLLKTFKAHYRSCTCLAWCDCGKYLVTGGADGMVHLFPLMDLVDLSSLKKSKRSSNLPLATWSVHQFPVTCLASVDGQRVASAASDGTIAILELFSKTTIATMKVPDGVESLTHHDSRLFVGSTKGSIYCIDLNAYAMHKTETQGASLVKKLRHNLNQNSNEDTVFGSSKEENGLHKYYQNEWIGHEHGVTCLAISLGEDDDSERLISGDMQGQVRIWDVESRTCLHVLQPWSTTTNNSKEDSSLSSSHPIASISVLKQPSSENKSSIFAIPSINKGRSSNWMPPLQKYSSPEEDDALIPIPFLKPSQNLKTLSYWQARTISRKRKTGPAAVEKLSLGESSKELEQAREKIARLEKELGEKAEEVTRWEKVNNKLIGKLKSKT